jgi:two-component system cell cycle sensor histidine kinase/response regulator CckA
MIRDIGRLVLSGQGYQILLASNGCEALEVYRRERDHIDLVILDLMMPQLSGLDTFRKLLQIDPEVRVLFASGCSSDELPEAELSQSRGYITKPFQIEELALAVRMALEPSPVSVDGPASEGPAPGHQWSGKISPSSR